MRCSHVVTWSRHLPLCPRQTVEVALLMLLRSRCNSTTRVAAMVRPVFAASAVHRHRWLPQVFYRSANSRNFPRVCLLFLSVFPCRSRLSSPACRMCQSRQLAKRSSGMLLPVSHPPGASCSTSTWCFLLHIHLQLVAQSTVVCVARRGDCTFCYFSGTKLL